MTYAGTSASSSNWVSPWHFGLNLDPTLLMIENHCSGMLWQLMRGFCYIQDGLRSARFEGGRL